MSLLELQEIETFYGKTQVIFGLSLQVEPGEFSLSSGAQWGRQDDDTQEHHGIDSSPSRSDSLPGPRYRRRISPSDRSSRNRLRPAGKDHLSRSDGAPKSGVTSSGPRRWPTRMDCGKGYCALSSTPRTGVQFGVRTQWRRAEDAGYWQSAHGQSHNFTARRAGRGTVPRCSFQAGRGPSRNTERRRQLALCRAQPTLCLGVEQSHLHHRARSGPISWDLG